MSYDKEQKFLDISKYIKKIKKSKMKKQIAKRRRIFKSMEQDGGRYNTAANVLQERIDELLDGEQDWR